MADRWTTVWSGGQADDSTRRCGPDIPEMICPKCKFEQEDSNAKCARCGVIFEKYYAWQQSLEQHAAYRDSAPETLADRLFRLPENDGAAALAGRTLVFLLILVLGWRFVFAPIDTAANSFMHLVNLPFHEAGHIVFMPFGRVMHSLGGSLGQLLMPLVCCGVLLFRTRDPFGASVALWWHGENYLDLAPYIDDARSLSLPLLGGNTGETAPYGFHDWQFILTELGLLKYDHVLARLTYGLGIFVMLTACLWGGYMLIRLYRRR